MRYDIVSQLMENAKWLERNFPEDDSAFAQWARAQAHAAIETYKQNELDATVRALAVCVANMCKLLESEMSMNSRRAM